MYWRLFFTGRLKSYAATIIRVTMQFSAKIVKVALRQRFVLNLKTLFYSLWYQSMSFQIICCMPYARPYSDVIWVVQIFILYYTWLSISVERQPCWGRGKIFEFWHPRTSENNLPNTLLVLSNWWIARRKRATKESNFYLSFFSTFMVHIMLHNYFVSIHFVRVTY